MKTNLPAPAENPVSRSGREISTDPCSIPPASQPSVRFKWPGRIALGVLLLLAYGPCLRATIPQAALNDPRAGLGYLVVTYYSGVDPTGVQDSTAGIQAAIDDASANYYNVFFPAGTYKVTDTLRLYNWAFWDPDRNSHANTASKSPALVGSRLGSSRPVIKLAAGASGFGDPNNAKPVIAYRKIEAVNSSGTSAVSIPNAFVVPTNFKFMGPDLFDYNMRDLDVDCNGQAGAVGISMDAAQQCSIQDVRVIATNAFAGFVDLPGPGGVANIEIDGGRYGVVMGNAPGVPVPSSYSWGSVVTSINGFRAYDQSIAALYVDNGSGPVQVTGFDIRPAAGGKVVSVSSSSGTAHGTFMLMDGVIDMANNSAAIAIDNTAGKSTNVRDVFVTNTDNLIKSGSLTATGSGTWKRIAAYAYTDQHAPDAGDPPYELNDSQFQTVSVIDGVVSSSPAEALKTIENNVAAPDADELISRHLWTELPSFEDGATGSNVVGVFANPLDYGATAETSLSAFSKPSNYRTGPDDTEAFQDAIDAASAAGHGRVMVPRGVFHISNTLTLHANTKFFGSSMLVSQIAVHDLWRPTTGSPPMIQTDDDADATTFFGYLGLCTRRSGGGITNGMNLYDRFSHVLWRAGRNSATVQWLPGEEFLDNTAGYPRYNMKFTGHGGGRHHAFSTIGRGTGGSGFRALIFDGTTEPVWFYCSNVEATKGGGVNTETNIEIDNASNIRLIGMKREGTPVPSVIMTNAHNVGIFGHEIYVDYDSPNAALQILGDSDDILVGWSGARGMVKGEAAPLLHEAITGHSAVDIEWPETISVYQRGTLDDAAAVIDGTSGGGGGGNPPPAPWQGDDVGSVGAAGSASYDAATGTYTVEGSGDNIYFNADSFHYVYQTWTGDATLIARVASVEDTNIYAKAGLMIRQSLDADAVHATVDVTPASGPNGVEFLRRTTAGQATTNTFQSGVNAPVWLKLVRAGNDFSAYYSADGISWTQLGTTQTITMTGTVYVGLVVCAVDNGVVNTSTFTDVSVSGNGSGNPPAPWQGGDVGAVGAAGSASYDAGTGTFTVQGSGDNIYFTTDSFHYVYQTWTGDATLITRVASVEDTGIYAKAGLMIRQSLDADAVHATVDVTPATGPNGVEFLRRTTAGQATTNTFQSGVSAPTWLKLVRSGNDFSAYYSADGTAWTQLGSTQTITMTGTVYVGLVVCAVNNGVLNTSTFTDVSVSGSGSAPAAPASLTAIASAPTEVDLSWPDVANETLYRIERKTGAGSYGALTTKSANETTHTDDTVSPDTTYTYHIRAENTNGVSAWTESSAVTTPGAAEIDVTGNGVSIADGDSTPDAADDTDFGSAGVSSGTVDRTFTIQNTGTAALTVGTVSISGTDAADFSVTDQPDTSVAASSSTTFTVRFAPSASGLRSATLSFGNGDANENPYDFSIQGTGAAPMTVEFESATVAANTDTYDVRGTQADVLLHADADGDYITFSVPNVAAGTYDIAVIVETGPNRGIFQLESSTSLGGTYTAHGAPQDTFHATTWVGGQAFAVASGVTFSTTGTRYFRFRVTGKNASSSGRTLALDKMTLTPQAAAPEIDVTGNSTSIADGDSTPSTADNTDFGSAAVSSGTVDRTFTIQNTGSVALSVGTVSISGTNAADFSVTDQPDTTVAANSSTTFTVRFAPSASGVRSASLSFSNGDADENPYDFSIQGTGASPMTVEFESTTVAANTDAYDVRTADVLFHATADGDYITFTVPNVPAGTYDIAVTVQTGPNRGIFQLESSTSLAGTYTAHGSPQDTYHATTWVDNQVLSVATNVTFSSTGTRYFRFRITGKNGSSTGRVIALNKMTLTP